MTISVLIPSHHDSPVLQKCIDSITKAAMKAPSVNTDIVLIAHNQRYDDITCSIPLHIYHIDDPAKKITIGELRNQALEKATGEYILFVDADDEVIENCFLSFQQAINEETYVISATTALFASGAVTSNALMYSFCTNVLVRRDILPVDVFPAWSMYEDNAFRSWIELNIKPTNLLYLQDVTYRYFGHAGQDGVRTGARFSTPEEFLYQFLSYCRWAVEGGLTDSSQLPYINPVIELLLDYVTDIGADTSYIEQYYERAYARKVDLCSPVTLIDPNKHRDRTLIYCDDPISGGEYKQNVEHKSQYMSSNIMTVIPTFILTTKCNRNCYYCWQKQTSYTSGIDTRTDEEICQDFINCYKEFKKYMPFIIPSLIGGEITLLSDKVAGDILKAISETTIYIYTNGANKDSLFYKDERCVITRHIVDWEQRPEIIPVNDREFFSIQIEHNKVEELIDYIRNDFPSELIPRLRIAPTRSPDENVCTTLDDVLKIQEAIGYEFFSPDILPNERKAYYQSKCQLQTSQLQVFCKEQTYVPCCAGEITSPKAFDSLLDWPPKKITYDCQNCLQYLFQVQQNIQDRSPYYVKKE